MAKPWSPVKEPKSPAGTVTTPWTVTVLPAEAAGGGDRDDVAMAKGAAAGEDGGEDHRAGSGRAATPIRDARGLDAHEGMRIEDSGGPAPRDKPGGLRAPARGRYTRAGYERDETRSIAMVDSAARARPRSVSPGLASCEIQVPPGFRVHVYVTGEGFDPSADRGARGIPSVSTLAFDPGG